MSLELPAGAARDDAEKEAAAQLRAEGVRAWSDLSLQTILTTDAPGISRHTFTYWQVGDVVFAVLVDPRAGVDGKLWCQGVSPWSVRGLLRQ